MPEIVSVHSFRGGTGKSNLTANLAASIAGCGNRVGIVDTDIQSPGIHILLGLDEEMMHRTLNDYLWGECTIEDAVYDVSSAVMSGRDGASETSGAIFLVPSSLKTGDIVRVLREGYDVARLNDGFQELINHVNLDYLFIDTHPGLNEETLLSITISNTLVIILRPDRQDFQGTAVTVDVAKKLDVPHLFLVLNKVLPSANFNDLRQQLETAYKAPVAGILPLSEDLVRLGSSDVFCLRFPDHPWTQEIKAIAQRIISER